MNVQELFPIVGGFILGAILVRLEPSNRLRVGVLLTVCIGLLATLASGEFLLHWGFAVLDISLVAASAAAGLLSAYLTQSVLRKQALPRS